MKYTYTKEYNTSYSYIDRTGKLGLVELMNINQDMITEFCGSIGSDNLILREKNNAAWIYTRTKVKINSLPVWNTKTKAVAFFSALSPIRAEIEVDLLGEGGEILFAAKTEMCVIDFVNRKVVKIDTVEFPKDVECLPSNITEPFTKPKTVFEPGDLRYSQIVYPCDTDFTEHTNNVRYVKYIMNTLDASFFSEKMVRDFEIHFTKESRAGDVLDIYRKDWGCADAGVSGSSEGAGAEAGAESVCCCEDASAGEAACCENGAGKYSFVIKNGEVAVVKIEMEYENA